jgi:hypothetical protein
MTYRTNGNRRPWEHRPSDHRAGMRGYWHGRLEPMPEQRDIFEGLFAKLLLKGRGK